MSIIGTGGAAGVAQTALQAQQVARQRDREDVRSTAEAKRLREMLESHMRALEEGDGFESPAQLHVDGDVHNEQRRPEHQTQSGPEQPEEDESDESTTVDQSVVAESTDGTRPYRRLDIQA